MNTVNYDTVRSFQGDPEGLSTMYELGWSPLKFTIVMKSTFSPALAHIQVFFLSKVTVTGKVLHS